MLSVFKSCALRSCEHYPSLQNSPGIYSIATITKVWAMSSFTGSNADYTDCLKSSCYKLHATKYSCLKNHSQIVDAIRNRILRFPETTQVHSVHFLRPHAALSPCTWHILFEHFARPLRHILCQCVQHAGLYNLPFAICKLPGKEVFIFENMPESFNFYH